MSRLENTQPVNIDIKSQHMNLVVISTHFIDHGFECCMLGDQKWTKTTRTQDNKLSVEMGNQVLSQLVDNILNQDEQTLAQKLLLLKCFYHLQQRHFDCF